MKPPLTTKRLRPRKATIERVKKGFLVTLSYPGHACGTVVPDVDRGLVAIQRYMKNGVTDFNRRQPDEHCPSAHRETGEG